MRQLSHFKAALLISEEVAGSNYSQINSFTLSRARLQKSYWLATAAYRDTFVLLIDYAERTLGKAPTALVMSDLAPTMIADFLDELESKRGNSVRTRNA